MCGIVGLYNFSSSIPSNSKLDDFMEQGLKIHALRGKDSTGMFINTVYGTSLFKKVVNAYDFFEFSQHREALSDLRGWQSRKRSTTKDSSIIPGNLCLGHTRAATLGKLSMENAHPHSAGDIVLVHNGTVPGKSKQGLSDSSRIAVDLNSIKTRNPEKVKKYLRELEYGSYTLVWYDYNDHTLNFARNKDRPLWFVHDKENCFFGSELEMVLLACRRTGTLDEKEKNIVQLKPHTYKKVDLGEGTVMDFEYRPKKSQWENSSDEGWRRSSAARTNLPATTNKQSYGMTSYDLGLMCTWCSTAIPDREEDSCLKVEGEGVFCPSCVEGDAGFHTWKEEVLDEHNGDEKSDVHKGGS